MRPVRDLPEDACRRFRWALGAAVGLGVLHTLLLIRFLVYPDLNLDYPFIGGDGYDWISQALHIAGFDVRYPGRPPLFPLIMAVLERLGLLRLTPVLIQGAIVAVTVVLYRTVSGRYDRSIALVVSVAFFVNFSWRSLGLQIMADVPAACLMLAAICAFSRGLEDSDRLPWAGLWGGLAAVTQPVAFLVGGPAAIVLRYFRRSEFPASRMWVSGGLLVAPTLIWIPLRQVWLGPTGSGPLHWPLLGLHLDTVPFYLWTGIAFVGLPGAMLLIMGVVITVRRARRDPWALFLVAGIGVVAAFFCCYGFASKRLLVHAFVFVPFFWAEALSGIRKRSVWIPVSAALILWSWLPSPGPLGTPLRVALWPAPATYIEGKPEPRDLGDVRVDFSRPSLKVSYSPIRWSILVRASRASRSFRPPTSDVEVLPSDRSIVFLSRGPEDDARRYRIVGQLGNALRRRVKFVSHDRLKPLIDGLDLDPVGRILRYRVFRTSLPSIDGTFLVVTASGRRSSGSPGPTEAGRIEAHRLIENLPPTDDVVAVIAPPDREKDLLVWLAFLVHSTNFYIIDTADPTETLRELGCTGLGPLPTGVEPLVGRCRILGYPTSVILLAGE